MPPQPPTPSDALTEIMLEVFRVNDLLLKKGNQLVAPLGMTSARWQVIGAIAISGQALACPQIASAMGVSRQGAQKQLNLAQDDGLVVTHENPHHARSPLYTLTESGKRSYDQAMTRHAPWATALAKGVTPEDLNTTLHVLQKLSTRLSSTPLPTLGANP